MKRHVIIGNGGAGVSAAKAIRSASGEDEVVIISREGCRGYSPVLATHYLAGHISYDDMFFVDDEFYLRNSIQTILGNRVNFINANARAVFLEDGDSVAFDNLLIATGSKPVVPHVPGVEGEGIFTLQTPEDAKRIDLWARRGSKAVVVGAGLIGMQASDALVRRGLRVSLIEKLDQIMPLALDAQGAAMVQRGLQERGVDLHLGIGVSAIGDAKGHKVVALESGNVVEANLVILATGVRPNVDPAAGCGVHTGRGIIVDKCARTSQDGIYAAGDVAEGPDRISGKTQVNATWFNAAEQGRVAGLTMAGIPASYFGNVRMNISFPLDIAIASIGIVNRTNEEQEEITSTSGDRYRKLIFERDHLVGAVLVGDVEDIGVLTGIVRREDERMGLRAGLGKGSASSCLARKFFVKAWSNGKTSPRAAACV